MEKSEIVKIFLLMNKEINVLEILYYILNYEIACTVY